MPLSAEELGQLYYEEAGSPSFWQDFIQPYLEVNLPGDYFVGLDHLNPNVNYFAQIDTFDNWWDTYGSVMPQDYDLGPADIDRAVRMGIMDQSALSTQFESERLLNEQSKGSSGFSNIGGFDDIWSRYAIESSNVGDQTASALSDIYTNQGQSILDQIQLLATEGAFDIPDDVTVDSVGDVDFGDEANLCNCSCYGAYGSYIPQSTGFGMICVPTPGTSGDQQTCC